MNYSDITNNVDSGRASLRRIARHDEPEFSNASILNSMETFVRTVSEMEDTILVPSRLLDLSVGDASDTISMKNKQGANIKDTLAHTDLYRLYNIVNQMKVELLWSQEPGKVPAHDQENEGSQKHVSEGTTRLGHNRCPSTTSMQSVKSASSIASITTSSSSSAASDCDSDNGIEIDSGLENEESNNRDRLANQAAENFRRHLRGLHRSIERMTEAAQYLTLRYQADVGGQV